MQFGEQLFDRSTTCVVAAAELDLLLQNAHAVADIVQLIEQRSQLPAQVHFFDEPNRTVTTPDQ